MARKRKIPARKHHGVRDPLKQIEQREKKLKNVINNPPAKDDQKASFKFSQFKKLADDAKAGKKFKRIHSGKEDKPADTSTRKQRKGATTSAAQKQIKQFIDEADEDYLKRVNRMTSESLKEAQYEAKYGVNVIRDPKTGAITIKKRPKNEIDELLKQKQNARLSGKTRKGKQTVSKPLDPKTAKALIKQAIKEDEEEKKKESMGPIEEYKHDVFKFGEVVHAPPTLSTLPRKAQKNETVPRPGKKNSLLLKSLLIDTATESVTPTATSATNKAKTKKTNSSVITKAQMRGKRKQLPTATRTMLESEQSKFVELYRQLKKSKEPL